MGAVAHKISICATKALNTSLISANERYLMVTNEPLVQGEGGMGRALLPSLT